MNYDADEHPQFVSDMGAYFVEQGFPLEGTPVLVQVEGNSSEWSYSEYTGGTDHTIEACLVTENDELDGSGQPRRNSYTINDLDLGDFLRFVYQRTALDNATPITETSDPRKKP